MRIMLNVLALVLFAAPTFAEEGMTDSEARKVADQGIVEFDEAWNSGDIKALGKQFTEDATFVTPVTMVTGRDAIEKNLALRAGNTHHASTVEAVHVLSPKIIWTTGTYAVEGSSGGEVPSFKGRWSSVNVLEADGWHQQFLTINVSPPPKSQAVQNPPMAVPTNEASGASNSK